MDGKNRKIPISAAATQPSAAATHVKCSSCESAFSLLLPDVKLRAVGDPRRRRCDGPEHGGQRQERRHAHRHSSGHVIKRNEEREPADDDEQT